MQRSRFQFFVIVVSSIGSWKIACAQNDGYPDTSFAQGGREAFSLGSVPNFPIGVPEMADRRLMLAGNCANACIARLHTDGSFDQSFGPAASGVFQLAHFPEAEDYFEVSAMALLTDGRIAISGCVETPDSEMGAIAIVRSLGDGLDLTMGINNSGYLEVIPSSCFNQLLIQPAGKFVVGSHVAILGYGTAMQVTRFKADLGAFDLSFGSGGIAQLKFELRGPSNTSQTDSITALSLQSNGKIVIGGFGYGPSSYFVGEFARLLSNGQIDTTFGGAASGEFHTDTSKAYDLKVTSQVIDSAGRVVFGGSVGGGGGATMVGRLTTDGVLDATFGGENVAAPGFGSPPQQVADVKIVGSEIVAGGTLPSPDGSIN